MELINLWLNALIHPKETFQKEKGNASLELTVKNIGLAGLIAGAIMGIFLGAIYGSIGYLIVAFVMSLVLVPIASIVNLFISSIIYFIVAKILGGKGNFVVQTYLISLILAPFTILSILGVIPFYIGVVIDIILFIYSLYPLTIALRETHEFSTLKAVLTWLLPLIIILGLSIGLVVLWQLAIFGGGGKFTSLTEDGGYIVNTAKGFERISVLDTSIQYSGSTLEFSLINGAGKAIENVEISLDGSGCKNPPSGIPKEKWGTGETAKLTATCNKKSPNELFSVNVTIEYDETVAGWPVHRKENGTIRGSAEGEEGYYPTTTVLTVPKKSRTFNEGSIEFIEQEVDYDEIRRPTEVGGKLAYIASQNDKEFVVYDGIEGKKHDRVWIVSDINGKLAYLVEDEEENRQFVVYDGREGKKYYKIDWDIIEVNGKLAYIAEEDVMVDGRIRAKEFLVYDGKEGKMYNGAHSLLKVNGKLAYVAVEEGKYFVVYDGKEGKKYNFVDFLTKVNGKLAYVVDEGVDSGDKEFIVYDGKEGDKRDIHVKDLIEVNGKLAYLAEEGGKDFIVYDGKVVVAYNWNEGDNSYSLWDLTDINGKLAYRVKESTYRELEGRMKEEEFIVYDEKEGKRYRSIWDITDINGKLAYIAYDPVEEGKTFIVYDGKEVGKEYSHFNGFAELNKKLVFLARKCKAEFFGCKWYIVREK